jgi:uncharacterized membrane protein
MVLEILMLRTIHILGGIFWLGSGLFMAFFLAPALATPGANAGQVFAGLQQRRLFAVLPAVAMLVVLSGLRLLWIASADSSAYFRSTPGRAFALAGALAILAFLTSLVIARPAHARWSALGASVATAAGDERAFLLRERDELQRRASVSSAIATTCLILSAVGMSIARYLP